MEGKADAASRVKEAITTSGIQHEAGEDGLAVRVDTPNCCAETMDATVRFLDCGKVRLKVRDLLGIKDKLMQLIFESARQRVRALLPKGVSISSFRAPDDNTEFGITERYYDAELS